MSRTSDVYELGLEMEEHEGEVGDEIDPHATLPFISHHTLNLSREIDDSKFSYLLGL